uniref:Uncharacterized protein n=1 Tax=Lactuca sativa TaxID=4236 RepID=A0A9R1VC98_LACSA|nr:hypothetical protein LSAT_V11C500251780 [Lactuca sativa]
MYGFKFRSVTKLNFSVISLFICFLYVAPMPIHNEIEFFCHFLVHLLSICRWAEITEYMHTHMQRHAHSRTDITAIVLNIKGHLCNYVKLA